MVKKVVVTKGKFKDYVDEIQAMSLDIHLIDYTRIPMVHLLFSFVFIVGGYMYWTMLLQWRLVVARLKRIQ